MNDDFLYKFRKPPRREFAAALYQKISGTGGSAPMKTTQTRALRTIGLAFSVFAVAAAVLFFSPSTRALAQSLMRQFGSYIFVQAASQPHIDQKDLIEKQGPVSPEQKATLQAEQQKKDQAQGKPEFTGTFAKDAAEASQAAGFTVLAPGYLPAGYTPSKTKDISEGWAISQADGTVTTMINYANDAAKGFLVVEELKYEQGQPTHTVDRPHIQDVTVRGQPGVWMPDEGGKSTLAWDENGITYLVVSNQLSLDESLKIAESLGK